MLRFRPDVKPPRWGGRAEVEFALRVNCERLGLPMPLAWSPMWGKDFGDTLVGSVRPGANGYEITAAAAASYVYVDVPTATLDGAALFYVGNQKTLGQYSNIFESNQSSYYVISNNDTPIDPSRITVRFGGSSVFGFHYLNASDFPLVNGGSWGWTGTCVGTKHTRLSVGWPSQRVIRHASTHSRANFNLAQPSQLRCVGSAGAAGKTVESLFLWPVFVPDFTMDQLHYQPHLLLMPVARPLYFDLGSVAPSVEGPAVITSESTISASGSKQATSPATVTASASVGMGGVKGAVAPLNIIGTLSIGASGSKSTSSPATITAAAEYGASGIKTLAGLDKEGPAVITASSTVGMGGVKCGVGAAVMGADSAMVAGGMKGAAGQAWFAAMGEFYAVRGPDELPITADEVARLVIAQARTKTVIAQARTKTVIAQGRQRSVRYEIA